MPASIYRQAYPFFDKLVIPVYRDSIVNGGVWRSNLFSVRLEEWRIEPEGFSDIVFRKYRSGHMIRAIITTGEDDAARLVAAMLSDTPVIDGLKSLTDGIGGREK